MMILTMYLPELEAKARAAGREGGLRSTEAAARPTSEKAARAFAPRAVGGKECVESTKAAAHLTKGQAVAAMTADEEGGLRSCSEAATHIANVQAVVVQKQLPNLPRGKL